MGTQNLSLTFGKWKFKKEYDVPFALGLGPETTVSFGPSSRDQALAPIGDRKMSRWDWNFSGAQTGGPDSRTCGRVNGWPFGRQATHGTRPGSDAMLECLRAAWADLNFTTPGRAPTVWISERRL